MIRLSRLWATHQRRVLTILSLSFLGAMQSAALAADHDDTYDLLVFSNPVAGTEAEYNRWYDKQHAPDVVSVPGFVSAQRYVLSDQQLRPDAKGPTKYLVLFKIRTHDIASVYAEVGRRNRDKLIAQSATFDRNSARNYTYRAITTVTAGAHGDAAAASRGEQSDYLQLVFSEAAPGHEQAFNRWYNEQHAPMVASTPGFQSWQRFELAGTQLAPGATEGAYLVIFNIASRNVGAVFEQFRKMATVPGPASNPGDSGHILAGYTYKAIGPLIDGDQVRADRAAHSR